MFDGGERGNRLIGCLDPFHHAQVDVELPEGLTIEQMLLAAGGDPALMRHGRCWLVHPRIAEIGSRGMVEVPREIWRVVRPKPDFTIQVSIAPGKGGGGKMALQIVLTIAVIVASIYLGPEIAGLAGYVEGVAGFSTAVSIAQAGVGLAGPLYIGMELPPP
jgi:hypothetical protein